MFLRILKPAVAIGAIWAVTDYRYMRNVHAKQDWDIKKLKFPSRNEIISNLKTDNFDVLIIGGGATGCGIAHAAASRGLKVGLVERNDFGSGTSCKSTKLIHGGVRYLQKAVTHLDVNEYNLVKESLQERKLLLQSCPNMVTPIPILLPCSSLFDFLFKSTGLGLYELISWDKSMAPKKMSKEEIKEKFPFLKTDDIYNGIIFYDGQFDDSRMNITVIKTSIAMGASACNYIEASEIKKGKDLQEVTLRDKLTNETFNCKTKFVVNATGPYIDSIRKKNNDKCTEICHPSSGVHLSMPKWLTDHKIGILIYEPNNRVLFVLPWEGTTLVGTSDEPTDINEKPEPSQKDVDSILKRLSTIFEDKSLCSTSNVRSCWSGLRPLVVDPNSPKNDTASFSRNHIIEVDGNFISVSGGKWTIFRKMGIDVADIITKNLSNGQEKIEDTYKLELYNSVGWTPQVTEKLINDFKIPEDVANHLSHSFGMEALEIAASCGFLTKLHPDYPYTEQEIAHICQNEYICSLEDVISRRTRLSFIDTVVTKQILEKISMIAKEKLNWSDSKRKSEIEKCMVFLDNEMGCKILEKKV